MLHLVLFRVCPIGHVRPNIGLFRIYITYVNGLLREPQYGIHSLCDGNQLSSEIATLTNALIVAMHICSRVEVDHSIWPAIIHFLFTHTSTCSQLNQENYTVSWNRSNSSVNIKFRKKCFLHILYQLKACNKFLFPYGFRFITSLKFFLNNNQYYFKINKPHFFVRVAIFLWENNEASLTKYLTLKTIGDNAQSQRACAKQ